MLFLTARLYRPPLLVLPNQLVANHLLTATNGRPLALDVHVGPVPKGGPMPVVIFCHGFKGFKDWGIWPLAMDALAEQGMAVVRMNFSLNGTTPEEPTAFADPEAFGRNTLSQEVADLGTVIDWLHADGREEFLPKGADLRTLTVIGHSRGGGIALVRANEDRRIGRVITWAGVADFFALFLGMDKNAWLRNGVAYIRNARTGQDLPLYWGLYQDLLLNAWRYDLAAIARTLRIPVLAIHGGKDETIPVHAGYQLVLASGRMQWAELAGATHTLGGVHPWNNNELPWDARTAVQLAAHFISNSK
jgi:pimeloyl-ACP methyl ester carboxylesterase